MQKHIDLQALSDELRDEYRESGMTQKEIAALTGLKFGTVKHWIEGRRPVAKVAHLQRLIDARIWVECF